MHTGSATVRSFDAPRKGSSWLSLLFFMMGAMNVYIFFRHQRDWLSKQGLKMLKLLFVSMASAALIESIIF